MQKFLRISAALICAAVLFSAKPVIAEGLSGFYIRGDLGGGFGDGTTFKDTNPTASDCSLCTATLPSSIGNSVIFGGGIGYRVSPAFRADITLDYLPSFKASGHLANASYIGTAAANVDSLVGLLNGYLDFNGLKPGLFGAFDPYVSAGFGFSDNDIGAATGSLDSLPFRLSGNTETSFAWAVGAGLGYALSPRLTLDLSYQYRDLGEIQSGSTGTIRGSTGPVTPATADLRVHTVTVGLRYAF